MTDEQIMALQGRELDEAAEAICKAALRVTHVRHGKKRGGRAE